MLGSAGGKAMSEEEEEEEEEEPSRRSCDYSYYSSYNWSTHYHHHHQNHHQVVTTSNSNKKNDGEQVILPPQSSPPPPPVAIADLTHFQKGNGLVATRDIQKGEYLWTETIPSIAFAMQMPSSSSSSDVNKLEPVRRACLACCACLEPASSVFDKNDISKSDDKEDDKNDNDNPLLLHLWPIREYSPEFESILLSREQSMEQQVSDTIDAQQQQHQFLVENGISGRILCRYCQALYCSRQCQMDFSSQVYSDCCRYRQALNAIVKVIEAMQSTTANNNDVDHDDNDTDNQRHSLGDFWEVFLATRIFASMITATTTTRTTASTTVTTQDVVLQNVLDNMCGDAADMTLLRVGIPNDNGEYSMAPFYDAISNILLQSSSSSSSSSSQSYDKDFFSLQYFERLVMICKQNALHIKMKSLFCMYEDAVINVCASQQETTSGCGGGENGGGGGGGGTGTVDSKVVMKNALTALFRNGVLRGTKDDDIEGLLGQLNCCAILALFSKLNHACDASVDVIDGLLLACSSSSSSMPPPRQPGGAAVGTGATGATGCRGRWLRIDLVATRDIVQGEELSVCYLSPENALQRDVSWRNERLQSIYNFTCGCSKCCLERQQQQEKQG